MTTEELEQTRKRTDVVDVNNANVVLTFVLFLFLPYLIFFGLLMLLTGEVSIVLLYGAVTAGQDMAVFKAWVIGTFVLSIAAAVILTLYRTEKYFAGRMEQQSKRSLRGGSATQHFVIESPEEVEESEASKARHASLDSVVGAKDQ